MTAGTTPAISAGGTSSPSSGGDINAAGGVNGRKVSLVIQDDSAEPSKAEKQAKRNKRLGGLFAFLITLYVRRSGRRAPGSRSSAWSVTARTARARPPA